MSISDEKVAGILVKSARHCCICRRFLPLNIQIHHIVEKENGGTDEEENLIPVCITCHSTIHTKTQMTKSFTSIELKGHRDKVYEMVAQGKLPSAAQISTGEMQTIAANIIETLKVENRHTDLSEDAIKLLLTAVCEGVTIQMKFLKNTVIVSIGNQVFYFSILDSEQFPNEILELVRKKYIKLEDESALITAKGISYVQNLVGTTAKYIEKKVKCLKCSLHFTIYSWNSNSHRAKDLHCPECGQADGAFLVWRQQKFGFIFNQVPGNASLWDRGRFNNK